MTRLRTEVRNQRGWEQIIAQLNAQEDQGAFLRGMLELQCRVVAAEYGALWAPDASGTPQVVVAWPDALAQTEATNPVFKMLAQAAAGGFEKGLSHILKVENPQQPTPPGEGTHLFVTVMRAGGKPVAVATVVADSHDPQVLQSTAPMRELAAGLYEGFLTRQQARAAAQESQQVRQAMAIVAAAQEAEGFHGSCLNLVNELARQFGCERVSLGWIRGRGIKLAAMSDTENLRRHSQEAVLMEMAMAEGLDQQQPVLCPIPEDAEPVLAQAVIYAHKKMIGNDAGHHALSIPLRHRDEWIGVLTFERRGSGFDAATIRQLQLIADVVGPDLADRHHSDRWLAGHAWQSIKKASGYVIGAKHVGWKLAVIGALALALTAAFSTWNYHVSAPFRLEAHNRRVLPAPFAGQIDRVYKQAGDHVQAGEVLLEFKTKERDLEKAEAEGKLEEAVVDYNNAMADSKLADAQGALAKQREMKARIALLQDQIDQAKVTSPVTGTILTGFWNDKVGGVVEAYSPLYEVAAENELTAVVRVSESDINQILTAVQQRGPDLPGSLATRSQPERVLNLKVERIIPAAHPVEGSNVFEVWCNLKDSDPELRQGMEGMAHLDVGRRPVRWILSHRIIDAVRLWLWW